ncbi:hypothetical protein U1Q18_042735 [Sarracenia purpurea var. burkii]
MEPQILNLKLNHANLSHTLKLGGIAPMVKRLHIIALYSSVSSQSLQLSSRSEAVVELGNALPTMAALLFAQPLTSLRSILAQMIEEWGAGRPKLQKLGLVKARFLNTVSQPQLGFHSQPSNLALSTSQLMQFSSTWAPVSIGA